MTPFGQKFATLKGLFKKVKQKLTGHLNKTYGEWAVQMLACPTRLINGGGGRTIQGPVSQQTEADENSCHAQRL